MSVWGELRRRNVYKVGAAYVIVAWLLAQVTTVLVPVLTLPDWVSRFVVLMLILGLPIALVLAWAYEITPDGIKRTKHVPLSESIRHISGRKLNYVLGGLLAAAVAYIAIEPYWPRGEPETARVDTVLSNSVAVLPFANLSPDPDNAFFAAGIHESILNQLAKISDLHVIARTSMLRYADGDKSIPEIASELNVETVMEGSVRYAGNNVRINAQLIDPATGAHLWSEEYDRELSDIFSIQSDIARRIAMALEAEFSLSEQAEIERRPTSSTEAYGLYLRAIAASGGRFPAFAGGAPLRELIDRAIELDPSFALAYALKAEFLDSIDEAGALAAVERALELDPNLGIAHAALADVHRINWRAREARQAFERAVELSPNDVSVLRRYAMFNAFTGRSRESVTLAESVLQLDPQNANSHSTLAWVYHFSGDEEAAAAAARNALEFAPAGYNERLMLGRIELSRGNLDEAEEQLRLAGQLIGGFPSLELAYGYRLAGLAEDALSLAQRAREEREDVTPETPRWFFYNLALGDYEQLLDALNAAVENRMPANFQPPGLLYVITNVWHDPVLDEPRFREVRDKLRFRE